MAQQIQVRRDTSANWTSAATVLAAGEIGFETNTGKFKIGDGSTAWASLTYFEAGAGGGGGATVLDDLTDVTITAAASGDILRYNGTAWVDAVGTTHFDAAGSAAAAQAASQPLDSDLTAIAALSTTAYGRAFLTLADQAATMALLSAASATASGIVELATNAETATGTDTTRAVTPANLASVLSSYLTTAAAASGYQPLDSDLTAIAALTTTSYGRAFLSLANLAALQAVLGTGTPSSSTYLRGDGTWSTPTAGSIATDTTWATKGDLIAATGNDAAAVVPVSTEGYLLVATPSASTGLGYASRTIRLAKPDATYVHLSHPAATGARAATLNRLSYVPFELLPDHPYTNFGIAISAADTGGSGVVRIGLYEWLPTGLPGTLLVDGGTVSTTTTGVKYVAISRTLRTNLVYVGYVFQGSVTSLTAAAGGNFNWPGSNGLYASSNREPQGCYFEDSISGALPSTPGSIVMSAHNSNTNHVIYAY